MEDRRTSNREKQRTEEHGRDSLQNAAEHDESEDRYGEEGWRAARESLHGDRELARNAQTRADERDHAQTGTTEG
jgi:hypothetical protein